MHASFKKASLTTAIRTKSVFMWNMDLSGAMPWYPPISTTVRSYQCSSTQRTDIILLGQILPMQASSLKTCWILGALKVAFTKRAAAIIRLAKKPKSVTELNQQSELVLNMFLATWPCLLGGKMTRKIGLESNKVWWGLKNLTFNFLRHLLRAGRASELYKAYFT